MITSVILVYLYLFLVFFWFRAKFFFFFEFVVNIMHFRSTNLEITRLSKKGSIGRKKCLGFCFLSLIDSKNAGE